MQGFFAICNENVLFYSYLFIEHIIDVVVKYTHIKLGE